MKNNKKLCLAILSLLLLIGNAFICSQGKEICTLFTRWNIESEISAGNELAYQVMHGNDTILSHSNIGLVLENGTIVVKLPVSQGKEGER